MANVYPAPTVTIASSASLSGAVNLQTGARPSALVGIIMPSTWTAADLTFQASNDGTNFYDLYQDDGTEYTISEPTGGFADAWVITTPADFAGIGWLKVRSGTSGTAVTQDTARTITLVVRTVR